MRKTIKIFQCKNQGDFCKNMQRSLAGNFLTKEEMEEVLSFRRETEATDDELLEELFCELNTEEALRQSMNYSLSVGDICQIDDQCYRCSLIKWTVM